MYAEATPHHFTLTEEDVPNYGTMCKMNPPVRTSWDKAKIIEGLMDGTIDMIATDHAPHSAGRERERVCRGAERDHRSGDGAGAGNHQSGKERLSFHDGSSGQNDRESGKTVQFDCGDISRGRAADLVIFDPDEVWQVEQFASKASNSPFLGAQLCGKVRYTICDGKIVYGLTRNAKEWGGNLPEFWQIRKYTER